MTKITSKRVWLIGGTSDSVAIARILSENKIFFIVTVATPEAKSLYCDFSNVAIGCMNKEQMGYFCLQEKIQTVIDASHPHAVDVSHNAIAICQELNLPYLRYERSSFKSKNISPLITKLDSFATLIAGNYLLRKKVLLTVGCQALPLFQSWQDRATLYARVLPKTKSLQIAETAGFTSDRLIALRPPLTLALEKALWQHWQVSLVVTKASGKAGGEDLKRKLATELNIPLIIIARPQIIYPQQTSTLLEVLNFALN